MSYSVCLACREMVGSYEKYCNRCAALYKQDKDFWIRTESYQCYNEPKRSEELKKDAIPAKLTTDGELTKMSNREFQYTGPWSTLKEDDENKKG